LAAVTATCLVIFLIANGSPDDHPWVFKLFLSLLVFFPIFIAISILRELYNLRGSKEWGLTFVILGLMLLYLFFMAPETKIYRHAHVVQFFIFMVITHLIVSFLPYLKSDNLDHFWAYNRSLFINFFVGALYSIIIVLGIFAALAAINYLFDADIDGEYFGYTVVLTSGIFHTGYFLSSFPDQYSLKTEGLEHDKIYINLVKYVLISLVCLYLLILYAFGVKILVDWELPKGFVASLVLGFSIIGILTYLLNFRLPEIEGSGWVKMYRKWFFYLLLPVISLLFVGIWRRINEYGFTEERYFVFIAGIFLAFICFYFVLSKRDDIRVIPIAIAICCLITGCGGPISAFNISRKSQFKKLTSQLELAGILVNGEVNEQPEKMTYEQSKSLKSIVRFFTDRRYFDEFESWLTEEEFSDPKSGKVFNALSKKLSLNNFTLSSGGSNKAYHNFRKKTFETTQITGYDYHRLLRNVRAEVPNTELLTLSFSDDYNSLEVYEKKEKIDVINLESMLAKLMSIDNNNYSSVPSEKMTLEHQGDSYDYKLVVNQFNYYKSENSNHTMDLNLYWKEKQ